MQPVNTSGVLIVIEGIDGAGKTTQAKRLVETLQRRHIPTIFSREPTDGKYGQKIRNLAVKGRDAITPQEEYRLFIDDRKDHVANIIKPSLKQGKVVVLDRYYFSTMAYQGALGLDPEKIRADNEAFCPVPNLAFLIDLPVAVGLKRIKIGRSGSPDLFEKEHYLDKVAHLFAELNDSFIFRIDGNADPDGVHRAIITQVDTLLKLYGY